MATAPQSALPPTDEAPSSGEPVSIGVPLGVQSDLQLLVDDQGVLIGVFLPQAPTLQAGTRVRSTLTMGVVSDSVEGVVAWSDLRRKTGVGIVFPTMTDAQRALLRRARLLHEATVVPADPLKMDP